MKPRRLQRATIFSIVTGSATSTEVAGLGVTNVAFDELKRGNRGRRPAQRVSGMSPRLLIAERERAATDSQGKTEIDRGTRTETRVTRDTRRRSGAAGTARRADPSAPGRPARDRLAPVAHGPRLTGRRRPAAGRAGPDGARLVPPGDAQAVHIIGVPCQFTNTAARTATSSR